MDSSSGLISEADFESVWGVQVSGSGDLLGHDEIVGLPINSVWTVVETCSGDDGNWYALPGIHVVNRLGFVLTLKCWDELTPDAIYFLDDVEH